ncbi:MAG: hypothetical protein HY321_08745 [Armatimonadetes bacterium]|nr:hypothetical protein [Armatimonadota bacterium]
MSSPVLRMAMVAGALGALAASSGPGAGAAPETETVTLFADDFSTYPVAYGKRPGPWQLRSIHYGWGGPHYRRRDHDLPLGIIERDGRRFLEQPTPQFHMENGKQGRQYLHNVVVMAGQPEWRDYALELELAVNNGPAGPIVRYQTNRRNYFVCFEAGQPVKLYRRDQDDHTLLAVSDPGVFVAEANRLYRCRVTCDGPRLGVAVDGQTIIDVADSIYTFGQIALRTEGPARFTGVKVLAERAEAERVAAARKRAEESEAKAARAVPQPKLIHTTTLPGSPRRMVGVHDVNDDGALEIAAYYPRETGPFKDASKVCVFDWQGKPLWELGPADEKEGWSPSPLWLNVADIDGDGHTEVICTRGGEILILEGATGAIKRRAPHPDTFARRRTMGPGMGGVPYIISAFVCNLRGRPSTRDIVFKDEYTNLWAYTDELEPLWHRHLNTGHAVAARDINGDGRDEVMGGYSMLNPDGTTLWTVPGGNPDYNTYERPPWPPAAAAKSPLTTGSPPDPSGEHNDRFIIGQFGPGPDAPLRIAIAASDLGFILLDAEGRLLANHRIGHAQWICAGRFRPDLPGRQMVVGTLWGNPNIFNLFDSEGNLLRIREPNIGPPMPLYWLGGEHALMLIGGSVYNHHLERLFKLPGSLVPPYAYDVNNDGLDEVLMLEGDQLRVYAPDGAKATFRAPKTTLTNWYGSDFYR